MKKTFKVLDGYIDTIEEKLNDLLDECDEVKVHGSHFYIDTDDLRLSVLVFLEKKDETEDLL